MGNGTFLQDIATERRLRLSVFNKPDPRATELWKNAMGLLTDAGRLELTRAYEYAKSIPYQHVGLSSEAYFSHPLRVAAMALLVDNEPVPENGTVGILHNVLEVSEVPETELASHFGASVAEQVRLLTVDRARQWETDYKADYYAGLMAGKRSTRIVKICDKLDNMFLLCLNPDTSVRNKYLWEIRKFLLPMVVDSLPELEIYINDLVVDCERTGFISASGNV